MRNFENWETQDLEMTFGISQVWESKLLDEWLAATEEYTPEEKKAIERLRIRTLKFADYWNEDELKLQCISIIIDIVDYTSDYYTVFSQRPLSATINGIAIGGRVDLMISKGRQKPIQPYFFIHKYKQERKRETDPKGQLLAELLTAQAKNDKQIPMYGCYVLGRNWFFIVLDGNEYAVSDAFVASQSDIYNIIAILRKIKEYVAVFIQK
jgi:hypothetical protein